MEKTILIADDEESILKTNKDFVEYLFPDYNVEIFEDGSSLKERLRGGPDGILAVVTDNDMPGVKGRNIIEEYATKPGFERVHFVLSYAGDRRIGEEAVTNGAALYVQKPDCPIPLLNELEGIKTA